MFRGLFKVHNIKSTNLGVKINKQKKIDILWPGLHFSYINDRVYDIYTERQVKKFNNISISYKIDDPINFVLNCKHNYDVLHNLFESESFDLLLNHEECDLIENRRDILGKLKENLNNNSELINFGARVIRMDLIGIPQIKQ